MNDGDVDYVQYFGLDEAPFRLTPDPGYLFFTPACKRVYRGVRRCVERGQGYAVVIGDIGTGKTTICRALLEDFESDMETAYVVNPFLSEKELLRTIISEFGLEPPDEGTPAAGTQQMVDQISDFLLESQSEGRPCVAIFDEAHNLPISALEQLRILGNLETNKRKLLHIVLVGQNELEDLLSSPRVTQLRQRIANWFRLEPLSPDEVGNYFQFRLERAGLERNLPLTPEARQLVHEYTDGYPRLMNILFDSALMETARHHKTRVEAEDVRNAGEGKRLKESLNSGRKETAAGSNKSISWVAIVVVITLVLGLAAGFLGRACVADGDSETPTAAGREAKEWSVVLDGFTSRQEAESTGRSAWEAAGNAVSGRGEAYVVRREGPGGSETFQICLGRFQDKDAARSVASRLEKQGYSPTVTNWADIQR